MRHTRTFGLTGLISALALSSAAVCQASPAQNAGLGRVTGYNLPQIRTFDSQGAPMGPQSVRDMPSLPAPIVEVRGATYGIRRANDVIFVRGIDVRLEGVGNCRTRETAARGDGAYRPGVDAGSGTALDCRGSQ